MPVEPPVESPSSLEAAYRLLTGGLLRPIAGGTDVMVQITGELGEPPRRMLDLWHLDELRGIARDGDDLVLGALTTYTELRRSRLVSEFLPELAEAAATIGAAQIQNRGTLGGNSANASPAGDTLPLLLATDAQLVLGSARGERTIAAHDFWTGYRQTAMAPDELIVRVRIPLANDRQVRFRKVGTRRAQAISKVVMALAWRTAADGGWEQVRLALGSVAERPIRAWETEQVLQGSLPSERTADQAVASLAAEIHPIDDVRSTAAYRLAVATRVLHRLIRDEGRW
ncbi:MAG TPA: xanthine dehydrogenase family protein subunit M, partial [Candidatus Limnocylindria bacterium]|nr:xanthine dehydrogenase family protein subunit M [Candidatus Limnocylindria bacterium]